jgi:glutathione S-transferase
VYTLHIANKNYSSWSLRPWVLMKELGIDFEEELHAFAEHGSSYPEFSKFSPSGLVPVLTDGAIAVWDSLGITEYLADRHPSVWPADAAAKAWARSAAAEMHSGFSALRSICTMNCGIRVQLASVPDDLRSDIARLEALWTEGLDRFGGPFLAGRDFTAADAFYCPVAFRAQTYGLSFGPKPAAYLERLRALPAMRDWYEAAIKETLREPAHEAEAKAAGIWMADLRATA